MTSFQHAESQCDEILDVVFATLAPEFPRMLDWLGLYSHSSNAGELWRDIHNTLCAFANWELMYSELGECLP